MVQRVCEKCGRVIDSPNTRNIMQTVTHYTRIVFFKEKEDRIETGVDLCNRCRDLFDEWLMTPPKETNGDA